MVINIVSYKIDLQFILIMIVEKGWNNTYNGSSKRDAYNEDCQEMLNLVRMITTKLMITKSLMMSIHTKKLPRERKGCT